MLMPQTRMFKKIQVSPEFRCFSSLGNLMVSIQSCYYKYRLISYVYIELLMLQRLIAYPEQKMLCMLAVSVGALNSMTFFYRNLLSEFSPNSGSKFCFW